jgi:hypothetical protein
MSKLLRVALTALMLSIVPMAHGQATISFQQVDPVLIPGSVRTLYVDVEHASDHNVQWSVSGGCTLETPVTWDQPQRVKAPAQGGTCMVRPGPPSNSDLPSLSSPVACVVTAYSHSAKISIVLPICSPAVELSVFPETTVLYRNQPAVIQTDLRGSTDTGVTWAVSANPGGAGVLTGGNENRHAIFSAPAAGTYVLTATSHADPRKKATTTIYVTGDDLPAPPPDHTEAVDCTAVGSGRTFEVGPERAFHDLNAVHWNVLRPGDTVRIHNDDTSGQNPTVYHQRIVLETTGKPGQPIRVCGVPDAHGLKPIVDGDNATTFRDADYASGYLENASVILLYAAQRKFDTVADNSQNILIEGLHVRNASPAYHFLNQASHAPTPYDGSAACIHVHTGRGVLVRGNELENCTQGIFSNSQTPQGSIVYDLTVEGNALEHWGAPHNELVHGMYLQGIGLAVQFNYFGPSVEQASGNAIKSRSVLNFLRWNYITQAASTARAFDLVEPQAFACYVIASTLRYYHTPNQSACISPHDGGASDPFSADEVAANFEAYHSDFIYGNILDDSGSDSAFVHYGYDQGSDDAPAYARRGGTLFYFNNTHLERRRNGFKEIFDPSHPDIGHSYEFPTMLSANNIFAAEGDTVYQWVQSLAARVIVDSTWMKPGSILPNRNKSDNYQGGTPFAVLSSCGGFGQCHPSNGHMEWGRNGHPGSEAATLYVGPTPFDTHTFRPEARLHGLAAPLPIGVRDQPSNMEFYPASNTIVYRPDPSWLGALDGSR